MEERRAVYFVSDVHLGLKVGDPVEREARFVNFLKGIPRGTTRAVCLLGDIWDFWYEYRDVVPREGIRVVSELIQLMDDGIDVYYCAGNHDIWTYRFFEDLGIRKVQQPFFTTFDGKVFCVYVDGKLHTYELPDMKWANMLTDVYDKSDFNWVERTFGLATAGIRLGATTINPGFAIRNGIRDYASAHGLTFFDLRNQMGLLRNMMIRLAEDADGHIREAMLLLQFCTNLESPQPRVRGQKAEPVPCESVPPLTYGAASGHLTGFAAAMNGLLTYIADSFPEITSLLYVVNNKCNDTIGDLPVVTFRGTDFIIEEMEGLRFKVGPKSFYQTNTRQAYNLYKVAREFAGLTGSELVYDLYTGTGTIANFVARSCRQVIGIEYVPEAIEDARVNASFNYLGNTLFYVGDMKDILTDGFIARHGRPDVIITDPPRAGMHADVVNVILNAEPRRIVYVSCNPATQARDLQLLDVKYRVARVQPVDMFPHTQHVENVVLLEKRSEE